MLLAEYNHSLDEQLGKEAALEAFDCPMMEREDALHRFWPTECPTSPGRLATVYFDPAVFRHRVGLGRIKRHYRAKDRKRQFWFKPLSLDELETTDIAKFPKAEKIFRQRGFVSDIDVQSFSKGDYNPKTTYRLRNRAAAHFQLSLIAHLLKQNPALVGGVDRRREQLSALMGKVGSAPTPLTSYRGMLLPRLRFWRSETVHFAYEAISASAIRDGHVDAYRLCSALPNELAEQVGFEARHSQQLFGASRPALLLWQTQALAMLRKAAWRIGFDGGTALHKQMTTEEVLKARALSAVYANDPSAVKINVPRADSQAIADAIDALKEAMGKQFKKRSLDENSNGASFSLATCSCRLSTNESIVAALHGSTYFPDFDFADKYDCAHPLHWLHPLAKWIGDLKRRRHAVLDTRVASLMLALSDPADDEFGHPPPFSFQPLIEARLGAPAWALIVEDILKMERAGISQEILIVYDWTRDAQRPWFAERRDGVIFIRGPLLDFPVHEAAEWNDNARIVDEEGGVVLHRRRDDEGNVL